MTGLTRDEKEDYARMKMTKDDLDDEARLKLTEMTRYDYGKLR